MTNSLAASRSSLAAPLVLHVRVVSGTGGGPDKTILNSPRFLRPLGYRSTCVYLRDPADAGFAMLEQRAAERDAPLLAIDDFGVKDWRIVGRIRDALKSDPPVIWHGHDYKSNLLGLLLRRHFPAMRLVTTVHGWVQKTRKTPLYYFVDRQCLPRYERVVCVSTDLYECCRKLGVKDSNLRLIENAIALDDYDVDYSPEEARARLGIPADRRVVVAVGRLSHEKGFDLLIQAAAELIGQGLPVTLLIGGEGAERESLEKLIASTGQGEHLRMLGFLADPRLLYRAADVYALSSRREGLPNVVLEAMVMGVPVVATRIAGMPALIDDGINGRLIPAGEVRALVSSLGELLRQPSIAMQLGRAGRQTVEARFSFDQRMRRMVDVYSSLEL